MQHHEKALLKAVTSGEDAPDFSGKWVNQLKSTASFTVSGSNVTGEYQSAVSDEGKPTPARPLVGTVNGDQIAFVVNWIDRPAITAWVGQLVNVDGEERLTTMWQLTMNTPENEEPAGLWQSVLAGSDTFTRAA